MVLLLAFALVAIPALSNPPSCIEALLNGPPVSLEQAEAHRTALNELVRLVSAYLPKEENRLQNPHSPSADHDLVFFIGDEPPAGWQSIVPTADEARTNTHYRAIAHELRALQQGPLAMHFITLPHLPRVRTGNPLSTLLLKDRTPRAPPPNGDLRNAARVAQVLDFLVSSAMPFGLLLSSQDIPMGQRMSLAWYVALARALISSAQTLVDLDNGGERTSSWKFYLSLLNVGTSILNAGTFWIHGILSASSVFIPLSLLPVSDLSLTFYRNRNVQPPADPHEKTPVSVHTETEMPLLHAIHRTFGERYRGRPSQGYWVWTSKQGLNHTLLIVSTGDAFREPRWHVLSWRDTAPLIATSETQEVPLSQDGVQAWLWGMVVDAALVPGDTLFRDLMALAPPLSEKRVTAKQLNAIGERFQGQAEQLLEALRNL